MTKASHVSMHAGFTLVELLVGLVVGSIVVATAVLAWSVSVGAGVYSLQTTRLNHDLRATMQLVEADLRRADPVRFTTGSPPVADFTKSSVQVLDDGSCVVFTVNALACEGVIDPGPDCWVPRGFRQEGEEMFTLVLETIDSVLDSAALCAEDPPTEGSGWFSISGGVDTATFGFTAFSAVPFYQCLDVDDARFDTGTQPCEDRSLGFTDWVENLRIQLSLEGRIEARGGERRLAIKDSVTVRNSVFNIQ